MAYLSTSADLIQRTYLWLRETSSAPQFWTSAQVVDALDESHAFVAADLNLYQSQWFTNTSSGQPHYTMPTDMAVIRHVLWLSAGTASKYTILERTGFLEAAMQADFLASGSPIAWCLAGVAGGPLIRLLPMPDHSAASGVYVIGNQTPETIEVSATSLPRQGRDMIALEAARRLWLRKGEAKESKVLAEEYQFRAKQWRRVFVDRDPDESDLHVLGEIGSTYPISTLGRPSRGFDPLGR